MRGDELLDKMELVDAEYVEAADVRVTRKRAAWVKWVAVAACLVVAVVVAVALLTNGSDGGELVLSDRSTAKVTVGVDGEEAFSDGSFIDYGDETTVFTMENTGAFRGTVRDLQNITIDFNGYEFYRCIATIDVSKVYKGNIQTDSQIKVLLPCAIDPDYANRPHPNYVSWIEVGMEGIFMPYMFDEDTYWEWDGVVLWELDLAQCGLMDGNNWTILAGNDYLHYRRTTFPGLEGATTLDDAEAYVLRMLG